MIIGLTGGIGSGKSTVAHIFNFFNVPVYTADEASKQLLDSDKALQSQLVHLLGKEIITEGKIDRPKMASIIFNDKALLAQVNALIHPAVGRDFKKWYKNQKTAYVIREAAILYESGTYKDCAAVISVSAPEEMRVDRVVRRNKITEDEVRSRMKNQWPQKQKDELADYVIYNDNSKSVIKQVIQVHEDILSKAEQTA